MTDISNTRSVDRSYGARVKPASIDLVYYPSRMNCLVYYDEPQLYFISDRQGRRYLLVALPVDPDYDEDDEPPFSYLAVRVSHRREGMILCSSTTLYEAFRFPEDGNHYIVNVGRGRPDDGDLPSVARYEGTPYPYMLPLPGVRLRGGNCSLYTYGLLPHRPQTRRETKRKGIRWNKGITSCIASREHATYTYLSSIRFARDKYLRMACRDDYEFVPVDRFRDGDIAPSGVFPGVVEVADRENGGTQRIMCVCRRVRGGRFVNPFYYDQPFDVQVVGAFRSSAAGGAFLGEPLTVRSDSYEDLTDADPVLVEE